MDVGHTFKRGSGKEYERSRKEGDGIDLESGITERMRTKTVNSRHD
ncbi:hypothetical protein QG37_03362 [Candidozyma auris]|uniref:Uncharacterized protein n=1 Tax=Candidozyma auris TaxID=498019 RepID=A0A0L0P0M2_CANAR|nr:hypothetical protein QG37_03362 [[Candida] auris]